MGSGSGIWIESGEGEKRSLGFWELCEKLIEEEGERLDGVVLVGEPVKVWRETPKTVASFLP